MVDELTSLSDNNAAGVPKMIIFVNFSCAMKFSQAEIFLPGRLSVDSDLFSKMSSNPLLEYIHIFGMAALKNYSAHIEAERNHLLIAVYQLEKKLRADMGVFGVKSVAYADHFQYCTTFKPTDPGILLLAR